MPYSDINPLDWNTVQPHVDRLLAVDLDASNADAWLQDWSDLLAVLQESAYMIQRQVAENTVDRAAEEKFLILVDQITPQTRMAEQALRDKLLAVEGYRPTSATTILMRNFRADARIYREENILLESELMKLSNQYEKTIGSLTVQWEGQEETIPQAVLHLHDQDRSVREKAWRRVMGRYGDERSTLNELYLEMLQVRRQVAANAGMANYRDYTWEVLRRFDYSPEDCQDFRDAIESEVAPLARRLNEDLASRLGLESLRPWDLDVDPYGDPLKPFQSVDELEDGAQRIFERVDPVLGGYFREMRDGFLDLESRPSKAPGGYCEGFPISRKPYIFMSAVPTADAVRTILHEGGHAFHFMESLQHPLVWNHNGPMEFCEVASMSMELLSAPYLERDNGGFYSPSDARRAYASQLEEIVRFLPYMAVVDGFQHWVYTEAPENVTAAELDAQWSSLWDRFMQGVDWRRLQSEKETGWHRKQHIFTNPFYYVEYGLAQLGALQVWRNALEDQNKAVADYRKALVMGNTRPLPDLFCAANARFAFDRQTIGELMKLVMQQLHQLRV